MIKFYFRSFSNFINKKAKFLSQSEYLGAQCQISDEIRESEEAQERKKEGAKQEQSQRQAMVLRVLIACKIYLILNSLSKQVANAQSLNTIIVPIAIKKML